MSYRKKETTVVVSQKSISDGIYDLRVKTDAAKECLPGQFVGVFPPSDAKMLMRPISICEADGEGILRMVYRTAGEGTKLLSGLKEGDPVDLLSILGNGFPIAEAAGKRIAIFGGGIGIPPMLYTSKEAGKLAAETEIYLGFRNSDIFLAEEFAPYGTVNVVTDDGSVGYRGNVLDAIRERGYRPDLIYACGPMPMLRAIKHYAEEVSAKAYISLEERMACGVGACLGCVCKTTKTDEHSHVNNARVCTEGPVFDAADVDI